MKPFRFFDTRQPMATRNIDKRRRKILIYNRIGIAVCLVFASIVIYSMYTY